MKKALIGFGGHAREVMSQMGTILPCFVDDQYLVKGALALSSFNPEEYEVLIAVADSNQRQKIAKRLPSETKFFTFIHPSSMLLGDIQLGEGTFIGACSVLTTDIKIGDHALLNRGNHIGHDCVIGNFFSAMPNSVVGGNVEIGSNVYLGSCSNIREKIKISDEVKIGMNSAVIKDIKEPGTYAGVPSKKIK